MVIPGTLTDVHNSSITILRVTTSLLLSCLVHTFSLSFTFIPLGKWHSVHSLYSHVITVVTWYLLCHQYCTNKPSVNSNLNFRIYKFSPVFSVYVTRELRTVALTSLLKNFLYPVVIHFLSTLHCYYRRPFIYPWPLGKNFFNCCIQWLVS